DDEQQRLAAALQIRWDLTQLYWSRIARFGTGRWPLEDLPWRTTDRVQTDYLSLLVSSVLVQDLTRRPNAESAERVARVLSELAERARITRRSLPNEPSIELHHPGFPLALVGSDSAGGPQLTWPLVDFSPLLLKQAIRVAGLMQDVEPRRQVVDLVDSVWTGHLRRRQLPNGGLWDQPEAIYPEIGPLGDAPSWGYTE